MILLDQPFVSELLLRTIRDHDLPVVLSAAAREFGAAELPSAVGEGEAVARILGTRHGIVHTVSESSLGWIARHLAATALPGQIARFKDKARFREDTASLFPDFAFRVVEAAALGRFDPSNVPCPFILKPATGFFSLGVRRVDAVADWPAARAEVEHEMSRAAGLFPREVLSASRFLIEPCVAGRELAVDAYFDAQGDPVVLSIFEHLFASARDMSDRVYLTSAAIVRDNLDRCMRLLEDLGAVFPVRNFAVHVELRVDDAGRSLPIEVNPVRFGGWCTTADVTCLAFGVNPYLALYRQERPDWDTALAGKEGKLFGLIALGNSTGIEGRAIRAFDYDGLGARFRHVLDLRRTDFRRYPIFGFVLTETREEDRAELEWALHSDLREFVTVG